jgi:hypothetical protein
VGLRERSALLKWAGQLVMVGRLVFLMAGASGLQAEDSKKEHGGLSRATASEKGRCEGTRKINVIMPVRHTTNDIPGCPKGGLLKGTDKADELAGEKGDDEIRSLGGSDLVWRTGGSTFCYTRCFRRE